MSKKTKSPMQKTKEYLADYKYRLSTMHEDDVESLEERTGIGYVWLSIKIIDELSAKIDQFERETA
jgi:predicted subunit of tRNA(5-methylaminomethyl-2-thiouridylate) methyltransferase